MRVALAAPSISDFYATPHRTTALGAHAVADQCVRLGAETVLFNFPLLTGKGIRIDLPEPSDYLNPFLIPGETGPVTFFTRFKRFGPSADECAGIILKENPDIVLLSLFSFAYASQLLTLAESLVQMKPGIVIGAGGAGVSSFPEYFVRHPEIAFAVRGESETVLAGILKNYRELRGVIDGPPPGEDELYPAAGYSSPAVYSISVARGCPKECRFCSNFLCHGNRFRTVPIDRVKEAFSMMAQDSFGSGGAAGTGNTGSRPVSINIEDDNLLIRPDYFFSVLRAAEAAFPGVRFTAENGIDHTFLTKPVLQKLLEAGFLQLNLSLASADPSILGQERRLSDPGRLENAILTAAGKNIPSVTYFICGLPGDTPGTVLSALEYLYTLPTLIGISPFYPVPGLPGFEDRQQFLDLPAHLCRGSACYPWTGSLSTRQLVTAFRLARTANFLKREARTPAEEDLKRLLIRERRLYTWKKSSGGSRVPFPLPDMDEEMSESFFRRILRTGR